MIESGFLLDHCQAFYMRIMITKKASWELLGMWWRETGGSPCFMFYVIFFSVEIRVRLRFYCESLFHLQSATSNASFSVTPLIYHMPLLDLQHLSCCVERSNGVRWE